RHRQDVGQIVKASNHLRSGGPFGVVSIDGDQHVPLHSSCARKLDRVANSAGQLLESLGINDPYEACDGPGDPEILGALVLAGEPSEDPVIEATPRTGRLAEIIDGALAAAELHHRAKRAAVARVGKLTVRGGDSW